MSNNLETIIELIIKGLDSLHIQGVIDTSTENLNQDSLLFDENGLVDSMALVTLVIQLEQDIEDAMSIYVPLVDDKALSEGNSPFKTIKALADYAFKRLRDIEG